MAADPGRLKAATVLLSILVYGVLLGVNFDRKVQEKHVQAWGEKPLGLPAIAFVFILETILFIPVPFFISHAMKLAFQAQMHPVFQSAFHEVTAELGGFDATSANVHPWGRPHCWSVQLGAMPKGWRATSGFSCSRSSSLNGYEI